MLKYLLAEGEISCVWKGEKKSTSFKNGSRMPELNFFQGDIVRFELRAQEEGGPNPITRITAKRRGGILYFQVFPSGRQRRPYNGLVTFSPDANREEQSFKWPQLSVNEMYGGEVGSMAVELHIKRLIG